MVDNAQVVCYQTSVCKGYMYVYIQDLCMYSTVRGWYSIVCRGTVFREDREELVLCRGGRGSIDRYCV